MKKSVLVIVYFAIAASLLGCGVTTKKVGNDNVYVLDKMSVDDITAECIYCFQNPPKNGQSYEDFYATCKIIPTFPENYNAVANTDKNYPKSYEVHDLITGIYYGGIRTEMDGNIGWDEATYHTIRVELVIQDYDRATCIYDFMDAYLRDYYTDVIESKEGTEWTLMGYMLPGEFDPDGKNGMLRLFLSMEKKDYGYKIKAQYYTHRDR